MPLVTINGAKIWHHWQGLRSNRYHESRFWEENSNEEWRKEDWQHPSEWWNVIHGGDMRTVRDPTQRKVFRSSRVLIFMNLKQTNHFRQVCKRRQICLQIENNVLVTCLVLVTQLPALMGARIAWIAIQILNNLLSNVDKRLLESCLDK